MDPHPESDVKGIVEEMAEDRGRGPKRPGPRKRATGDQPGPGTARTVVFGIVAVMVLLTAVLLLAGGGKNGDDEGFQVLAGRLDLIERRLDRLEGIHGQVDDLSGKTSALGDSLSRLERERRSLNAEVETLSRRLESMARASPPAKAEKAAAEGPVTHTVERGQTLFGIARLHGLTVDELCRLNRMKKTDVIQPGQDLVVSPGVGG
jgi:LysM repeat protein